MAVSRDQRHTRQNRCPICDGGEGDPRGQERRCFGWTSGDGEWVHCTREDFAGQLSQWTDGTYVHRAHGECKCGVTHNEDSGVHMKTQERYEALYDYRDEFGVLRFQVVRVSGPRKMFFQRRPDGAGGWVNNLEGVQRVPYRYPELIASSGAVYVVEGEKDADTVARLGHVATTNPGGAGKWRYIELSAKQVLRGRDVIVVADADEPGRQHAAAIAASLQGVAKSVRVVEPPAPYKDLTDMVEGGLRLDALVDPNPDDQPAKPRHDKYVIESAEEIASPLPPLQWVCQSLRIARGAIAIAGGYGYSRKTLFAQSVGLAIAAGKTAFGLFHVERVPVLHIDYEQGQRITRERYQRLARAEGIELRESSLSVVTFPRFKLSDRDAQEWVARLLEETKAGFVVVDSLRASVAGVDENDSRMREFIDLVGQETKKVDASSMFIHHARKPGDGKLAGKYSLRGSGAIFDAVDEVFVFTGEKGQPSLVEHEKDRLMGAELPPFGLDSEDAEGEGQPRWGLRVKYMCSEELRERAEGRAQSAQDASRRARESSVREYLSRQPQGRWTGSRTELAKAVGGKTAEVMGAIAALVTRSAIVETIQGRKTVALEWRGM